MTTHDAGIPLVEVNNKAGFGRSEVNVLTYVGADDVEFGRLQRKLLDMAFGGKKAAAAANLRKCGAIGQAAKSGELPRTEWWSGGDSN